MQPYEPSYLLLKESRESWDYAICDELVHLLQPIDVAPDSFVGVAKDYVDGNLWIECHVTFEEYGNAYHFCVVVEYGKGPELLGEIGEVEINDRRIRRDSTVLVDITQGIESPKQMAADCCPISSVVRLKLIDDCDCLCGYAGGKCREPGGIGFLENRELCSVGVVYASSLRQDPNKLIEGRSQTIQKISDHKRDFIGIAIYASSKCSGRLSEPSRKQSPCRQLR
jgi:hypothetical protein